MAISSEPSELLAQKAPQEYGGSVAQNGFDFQRDWSIAKLLDIHRLNTNYFMLFDYHEDVVVVISNSTDQKAFFYQIKKRSNGKAWTLSDLLRLSAAKKRSKRSIIGKMRVHEISFPNLINTLSFVSNEVCSIELNDGVNGKVKALTFDHFSDDSKKKIKKALKKEFPDLDEFNSFSIYEIEDAELHPHNHEEHVIGKLTKFLDDVCPNRQCRVQNVYNQLYAEVKRRCALEYKYENLPDLVAHKGMDRDYFESKILKPIRESQSIARYDNSLNELEKESIPYWRRSNIQNACRRYLAQRLDASDSNLMNLRDAIIDEIKAIRIRNEKHESLTRRIDDVIERLHKNGTMIPSMIDKEYLYAMVIIENEEII